MATIMSDERYTPQHVLDVVRKFGPIACDPCTTADNPTGAAVYFTAKQDGLKEEPWPDGVTWCNPQYSRGQLQKWVACCYMRKSHHLDSHVLALIPSDLGTNAGGFAAATADGLCFVRGRLKFGTPDGQNVTGAKQPSVIVYWGNNSKRFAEVFSELGVVWVR
jgi:hypothetical protein